MRVAACSPPFSPGAETAVGMLKRRLIPVLYLQHGQMVRSETFSLHQAIGHPVIHVERLVQWDVDELIVLDIGTGEESYDFGRDDTRRKGAGDLMQFINNMAAECHIPLAFGGRIRTLDHVHRCIANGADKITLNTALSDQPGLVTEAAHLYGSQAVVGSVDYRMVDGVPMAFTDHGVRATGIGATEWARHAADLGAGEILLNSIDRDGTAKGYDLETIQMVVEAVEVPVIACGGAGHQSHFRRCFDETGASAVAAGNIFHFTENAYPRAKTYLRQHRNDIR